MKDKRIEKPLNKRVKALKNQGFTLFELIIVIALLSIVIGFAAVGISGYFDAADQMERSEVAETSFYSLQSHVNYLKRKGELEKFEEQIMVYNQSVYGQDNILSADQNRTIIELNYEGGDASAFYNNEYLPAHQESEILYITLDQSQSNKEQNPLYPILSAALQNEEVMANSFLVEYDLSTGVVRSVFYSEEVQRLTYNFGAVGGAEDNQADCIYRSAKSLSDKKQGYYGLTFTASEYTEKVLELLAPKEVMLVNEDRLYLTWMEENSNNPAFTGGGYQIEELTYLVTLYDQENKEIAIYELSRGEMYEDATGTEAAVLNYIDDFSTPVEDTLVESTKQARVGFADLSYAEAPDGIAGEYYYLLLECLDHPFGENGYDFSPEDTMYATVELSYGAEGTVAAEEIVDSNEESVYFAHVENEAGAQEFGVAYSRHLWNIRHGLYDGDYRLIADVDWANIEDRAREITFTSTQFEDELVAGVYHTFEGTFTGKKEGDEAESADYLYSNYQIHGVSISEEENEQVGLFTINRGTIDNITLSDFFIGGAKKAGALAGLNMGTMENICVLNVAAEGQEEIGGLTGYNEGTITGCTVTTGENRITAQHTVGGMAGYSENSVTNSQTACNVETILPEGTDKISTSKLGRYAGGVIGYLKAGAHVENLYSGVLLDQAAGLPLASNARSREESNETAQNRVCSNVTGVAYVGGVIGEIEAGAGEFTNLYNYAKLNVTYVDAEERAARSDASSPIYNYYGGITGRIYVGNSLKDCVNYAVVSLDFLKDGQACDATEIYDYIRQYPANDCYWNLPRYIGGIAGYNQGKVEDCISLCGDYKTFEEELDEYRKVRKGEAGCYVGAYVGGLVGYNEAEVLFTGNLSVDTMQVVVKAYTFSSGGLVGYAKTGSIRNESGMLTVQGVVASRGSENPQIQKAVASEGGIVGYVAAGEFTGTYTNDAYVMGKNAGGITGYLAKGFTLENCNNTGIVYGRGLNSVSTAGGIGGIVGNNYGTLIECSNTGIVSGTQYMDKITGTAASDEDSYAVYIGGVAGYNAGTVENCHSKMNEEKSNYIVGNNVAKLGGIVGYNQNNGTSYLGVVRNDKEEVVDIPIIVGAANYTNYPTRAGGIIGDASGQLELKDYIYSGEIDARGSSNSTSTGIGGIVGSMAKNHSMSSCTMKGQITSKIGNTGGLIGLMSGGVVEDTNEVTAEAVIEGSNAVGGIIGRSAVTDTASHVDIIENKAQVTGNNYVGGIVGWVSYGQYLDLSNRSNSGQVTGIQYVGGLAGYYNMGALETVTNCENTGDVFGKKMAGGIIGSVKCSDQTVVYSFTKLTNSGTVMANSTGGSGFGGIAGEVDVPFVISECVNEGEIGQLDENYQATILGGVSGQILKGGTIEKCSNKGNISGYANVGGIAGNISYGINNMVIQDCTNEKGVHVVATGGCAGGIVGKAGASNMPLTVTGCVNRGYLDSPHSVGGVAGRTDNCIVNISDSHNYGVIGQYSAGRWTLYNTGGIVGYAYSSSLDVEASVIKNCTQKANMYQIKNQSNGAGIGGMVGRAYTPILIENCSYGSSTEKYNINTVEMAYAIGGIIGNGAKTTIKNCHSNVDVEGDSEGSWIGGMIGMSSELTIGEQGKEDTYCDSYGDINLTGTIINSGGIAGYITTKNFVIYGSTNYGNIGAKATRIAQCGGIIGFIDINHRQEADGILEDCTQLGQLYQGDHSIGGIVGKNFGHNLVIRNCTNGAESIPDSGNIYIIASGGNCVGGLVGISGGQTKVEGIERTLLMQKSVNYGDIYLENYATKIGGLVGQCSVNLTIGDEADATLTCYNYGNIGGSEQATVSYAGGIVGSCPEYLASTLHIYDSINYGNIGEGLKGVSGSGGIAGGIWQNSELSRCTNFGKITNIEGASVGGIAGYITKIDTITISQCVNGEMDNAEAGVLEADGNFLGIGGIIGRIGADTASSTGKWSVTDCVNYAEIRTGAPGYWVGGICGLKATKVEMVFENTKNYGDIVVKGNLVYKIGGILGCGYQTGGNIYIGAALEDGSTDMTKVCVNYGEIRFEENATGNRVGGIVGEGTGVSIYGASNEADIRHDDTSVVAGIGGIGAYFAGTTYLQDCKQNGVIYYMDYASATASGRNTGAGGIASYITGTATILRCDNGSEEARQAGEQDGCIIAKSNKTGNTASSIGGIVARNYAAMDMEDCNNYADITIVANATYVGGVVGYGEKSNIQSCNNYANIQGEGNLDYAAGILGYGDNVTIGNEAEGTGICINYGDIYATGKEQYIGGIAGYIITNASLYGCQNKGNIALGNVAGTYIGGIAGDIGNTTNMVYANATIRVIDCVNEGNLLTGTLATADSKYSCLGGIAGRIYGGYQPSGTMVKDCINSGDIGWVGYPGYGNANGGIAGSGVGTYQNCTNLGSIYVGTHNTQNEGVGGIIGTIHSYAEFTTIIDCVNGSASEETAGVIDLERYANNVGGIVGYTSAGLTNPQLNSGETVYKKILITDCTNYGDIRLNVVEKNRCVGGIFANIGDASVMVSQLEILRCENYGDIENAYMFAGGIISTTGSWNSYLVSECINYGDITAQAVDGSIGYQQYGGIGGIGASLSVNGGYIHCVNAGNITGANGRMGGLFGISGNGYAINCYNLGTVINSANRMTGDLIGRADTAGDLIDCYSYTSANGKLAGVMAGAQPNYFWQAGTDGYLTQAVYNSLCSIFGVSPAWSTSDLVTAVKPLLENYKYEPSAPTAANITYTAADTTVEGSVPSITLDLMNTNYAASKGMEIYLYESSMAEADILADTTGDLASWSTMVSFQNGRVPDSVSIDFPDELLPMIETTYVVVIKTLGYSTSDGTSITTDTERAIQGDITLPAAPITTFGLRPTVSGGDSVSDGDSLEEDTISGGDSLPDESVPNGDSTGGSSSDSVDSAGDDTTNEDIPQDTVSGGDGIEFMDTVSGNDIAA